MVAHCERAGVLLRLRLRLLAGEPERAGDLQQGVETRQCASWYQGGAIPLNPAHCGLLQHYGRRCNSRARPGTHLEVERAGLLLRLRAGLLLLLLDRLLLLLRPLLLLRLRRGLRSLPRLRERLLR